MMILLKYQKTIKYPQGNAKIVKADVWKLFWQLKHPNSLPKVRQSVSVSTTTNTTSRSNFSPSQKPIIFFSAMHPLSSCFSDTSDWTLQLVACVAAPSLAMCGAQTVARSLNYQENSEKQQTAAQD